MPTDNFAVRILVFSASLRTGSLNARLASLAARVVESHGGTVDRASMQDFDCPSYDGDEERDGHVPGGAIRMKERLIASDAFLIVSPEYNASMPGMLKNTIDWVSRLRPQPFTRRYGMLMSASPSMVGGNRGLWALRVPLEHLGARVYPDMFSLAQAHEAFAEDGGLRNAKLQERFDAAISCWLQSVEAATHYPMMKTQWVEFLGERPDSATDRVEQSGRARRVTAVGIKRMGTVLHGITRPTASIGQNRVGNASGRVVAITVTITPPSDNPAWCISSTARFWDSQRRPPFRHSRMRSPYATSFLSNESASDETAARLWNLRSQVR